MNISQNQLTRWIVKYHDIWQENFADPEKLSLYVKMREVIFEGGHITKLWKLGWLRADLINSQEQYEIEGINYIQTDERGNKYYSDDRNLVERNENIELVLRSLDKFPDDLRAYFHPFRLYVLYQIKRCIEFNIFPFQFLIQSAYPKMLGYHIRRTNEWVASKGFPALVKQWNDVVSLAVATDPCYLSTVSGFTRYIGSMAHEQSVKKTSEYKNELKELYQEIDKDTIIQILQQLCFNAEILDPNKQLHILLRLAQGRNRKEVFGRIGGALTLKTMAEIIRRMAEEAHGVYYPEEDELSHGFLRQGVKEKLYGTNRIFDEHIAKQQIIRDLGLDPGVRARCYVEGETEYFALNYLLSSDPQIQIENLAGQVTAGRKKGIGFRDNLVHDKKARIFSFIFIDGDTTDNVKVVREAATKDLFCGQFLISSPDFELQNFTREELEEIIWEFLDDDEKNISNRSAIHSIVETQESAKKIFDGIRRNILSLNQFGKGKEWGEKLAEYIWQNPCFSDTKTKRPFFDAIIFPLRSNSLDFLDHQQNYCVNPETGLLIKR